MKRCIMSETEVDKIIEKVKAYLGQLEVLLSENRKEPQPPAEALKKAESSICLLCDNVIGRDEKKWRGCHERCHQKISRQIKSGEVTDKQAITRGWWLPKKKGGRTPDEVTQQKFEASKRKK
jgi:hypothetical protein